MSEREQKIKLYNITIQMLRICHLPEIVDLGFYKYDVKLEAWKRINKLSGNDVSKAIVTLREMCK